MHDSRAYLFAHAAAIETQLSAGICKCVSAAWAKAVWCTDRDTAVLAHADASDSSAYVNSAAHADLWCGPGSAKIAIKHFFSNATAETEVSIQSISFMLSCDTK